MLKIFGDDPPYKRWIAGESPKWSELPPVLCGMSGLYDLGREPAVIIRGYGSVGTNPPIVYWSGRSTFGWKPDSYIWPKAVSFREPIDSGRTARWCADILHSLGITMWIFLDEYQEEQLRTVQYEMPPIWANGCWRGQFAHPKLRDARSA